MLAELERRGVAELKGRWAGRGGNGSSRDATPRGSGQAWSAGLGRSIQCVSVDSCFFFVLLSCVSIRFLHHGLQLAKRWLGEASWRRVRTTEGPNRGRLRWLRRQGCTCTTPGAQAPVIGNWPARSLRRSGKRLRSSRLPPSKLERAGFRHPPVQLTSLGFRLHLRLPSDPASTGQPGSAESSPPSRLPPRSDFEAKRQALAIHLPAP